MAITDWLSARQLMVETELESVFNNIESTTSKHFLEAMRYGVLGGGKRIRPLLLFSIAEIFTEVNTAAIKPACAVELIHCYSLIHDDLPAMDDDDLRRGKLSCHKKYNEATAILVGDVLQSLAFELLNTSQILDSNKVRLNSILAVACRNMVFGQALDMQLESSLAKSVISIEELTITHKYKTSSLITAGLLMGAVIAGIKVDLMPVIKNIGNNLGMAFQIQDDILDVTADTEDLGKPAGSDQQQNKPTFVSILGLEVARQKLTQYYSQVKTDIKKLNGDTDKLANLAELIVNRQY